MAAAITEENVQKTVFEALPQFGVDESQISRDATFEDLDVDSLDLAELSQIIEDEYGVALKGDDVGKIKTVGDAIDLVVSQGLSRDVVITGVGAVSALGVGARTLHERWSAGVVGIEDGEGAATEFHPTEHLSIKEARRADRFTQFAIVAGDEALAEAGWSDELPYQADRIASILGTGIGGIGTLERGKEILMEEGAKKVPPLSVPLMMSNAAAAAVSMRYKLLGPCHGIVSACSGGADAIGAAKMMIESGLVDAVVTGGSEAALTPLSNAAFSALDALSVKGISRPFDKDRDGFVMGEGAGILVLEASDTAAERGAKVLGTLRGYGASADAFHLTAPDKTGGGPSRAMLAAMKDAGIKPEDVVYVNAHGTSTELNDAAETMALKLALGDQAYKIPISSLKSTIGHLLGAAGAVEAVATILALRDRIAPPTLGLEHPGEGLDLDYVPGSAKPLEIDGKPAIALSSSFGFGGHNAVLCLEAA